jgi:hypothetical protein
MPWSKDANHWDLKVVLNWSQQLKLADSGWQPEEYRFRLTGQNSQIWYQKEFFIHRWKPGRWSTEMSQRTGIRIRRWLESRNHCFHFNTDSDLVVRCLRLEIINFRQGCLFPGYSLIVQSSDLICELRVWPVAFTQLLTMAAWICPHQSDKAHHNQRTRENSLRIMSHQVMKRNEIKRCVWPSSWMNAIH